MIVLLASLGVVVHDKGFAISGARNQLKLSSPVEEKNNEKNSSEPINASKNETTDEDNFLDDIISKAKHTLENEEEEEEENKRKSGSRGDGV